MKNGKKGRQVAINLIGEGLAITITCNLKSTGPANVLPPKTTRHKTAFLVIEDDNKKQTP